MTREEAIMILKNEQPHCGKRALFPEEKRYEAYDVAIKALEQQTCEDAVSREAVLMELGKYLCGVPFDEKGIDEVIKELPSIQPEITACTDAVSREAVLDIFADNADAIRPYSKTWEEVKALPSVNPQPKWIPVSESERLPTDIVLLSLPPHIDPNGEECSASVICGHYIGGKDKEWGLSDGDTFGYGIVSVRKGTNPIAWMPLPKKYEPQESEG